MILTSFLASAGKTFMLHFPIYKINISVLLVVQSAASTALQGSSVPSKCHGGLSPQSFCFFKLINNLRNFLSFCWHYRFRSFTVTFITVSESKLHKLWSCFPNLELNFCRTLLDLFHSHWSFPSSGGCAPPRSLSVQHFSASLGVVLKLNLKTIKNKFCPTAREAQETFVSPKLEQKFGEFQLTKTFLIFLPLLVICLNLVRATFPFNAV